MSVIAFNVAAKAEVTKALEEAEVALVVIDGVEYTVPRPTSAQVGMFISTLRTASVGEAVFEMVEVLLGRDGLRHIQRLVKERRIELSDLFGGSELNPSGLIGNIIEEFSGRPTQPSTDSSESQPSGGRKSTGRARGKGSIPSTSPSTDS